MDKIKTYIIVLVATFPQWHTKKEQYTYFKESIFNGISQGQRGLKIHTIRGSYELWKKRIDEINSGKAILSIRQWTGKPYHSRQVEILRLEKAGIQKIRSMDDTHAYIVNDKGNVLPVPLQELSANDGLELSDFMEWLRHSGPAPNNPMAIIHFTEYRYWNYR